MINQSGFHHPENCPGVQNPPVWPCKTETFYNPAVDLGQYLMSRSQLEMWDDWKTEDLKEMGQYIIQNSTAFLNSQGWLYMVNLNDGYLYTRMQ